MKKKRSSLIFFLLLIIFSGCLQDNTESKKVLAKINDFHLSLDEFQKQLAREVNIEKEFKLTKQARDQFLEELIKKELLIQEAKKLKLDRKENFLRTIERYWESTLIRNLMELKGKEFSQRTYICTEEIESYYKELQKLDKNTPPLDRIKETLSKELAEKKKTEMLFKWLEELRQKAKIEINHEFLNEK